MQVAWAPEAFDDLHRLHAFLASKSQRAADHASAALFDAPKRLLRMPRAGSRVDSFSDKEIRRILVGPYEVRYEIDGETIRILRIFHTREDR